jgi:ABC-type lipoprotein release transport system permease subunit
VGFAASTIGIGLAGAYLERTVGLSLALSVDPRSAIVVLAGTSVLAAVAGILPASLAYRTPVGEVLRPSA